jgi:adenylate cyclase
MAKEIEKKFLLMENGKDYSNELTNKLFGSINNLEKLVRAEGVKISQGYLPKNSFDKKLQILKQENFLGEEVSFKPELLRLREFGGKYLMTIKGKGFIERDELEFPIPEKLFNNWWKETKGQRVEKIRYEHHYNSLKLEIDCFTDRKLMLLEIEVKTKKAASLLPYFGKDVSETAKYTNMNLAK